MIIALLPQAKRVSQNSLLSMAMCRLPTAGKREAYSSHDAHLGRRPPDAAAL